MLHLRTRQETSILLTEELWRYGSPFQGLDPDHEAAGTQAAWLGLAQSGLQPYKQKSVSPVSSVSFERASLDNKLPTRSGLFKA
jgi:hypothetical protein